LKCNKINYKSDLCLAVGALDVFTLDGPPVCMQKSLCVICVIMCNTSIEYIFKNYPLFSKTPHLNIIFIENLLF